MLGNASLGRLLESTAIGKLLKCTANTLLLLHHHCRAAWRLLCFCCTAAADCFIALVLVVRLFLSNPHTCTLFCAYTHRTCRNRNVNASCVNGNVVNAVVQRNTSCWDGCGPDSKNMSSTCWIDCLFNVLTGADQDQPAMTDTEILAPFEASFATDDPSKGGCPTIPACPAPCHPPTEMPALEEVAPTAAAVDADAAFLATTASLEEALAVLQGKTLDNCNPVAWDFCCEVGTKCDCSKGITAPGQCKTDSYDFCCGVGKVCDCTTPPPV